MMKSVVKSQRRYVLEAAYRKHQAAIQSAIQTRQRTEGSQIVTLRNGMQLRIAHTSQGYQVVGVLHDRLSGGRA